jgi:cytochrome P450
MKHWFSDVGHFRRDPLKFFLDRAASSDDPAIRLRLGPKRVWLVTDPTAARDILKQDEKLVDKGHFIRKLRPIVGHSLLTINGDENARRRRALHAVFTKGVSQKYVPEMSAVIREAASGLVYRNEFNAHALTAPLTLRMICVAMFGKGVLNRSDEALILNAVRLVEDDLAKELFRAAPATPWARRAQSKRRDEARYMTKIVVDRVRTSASESSVLAALIGLDLDDETIRDEIVTMLIAGHHTTGSAAAWIMYYLAREPQLAAQIAAEAFELTRSTGEFTYETLQRATVSAALVKEVLRLFPSAHWFARDARSAIEIGKVTIKRGDALIFCPWQLHRDPRHWSNADQFDVTRSFASKSYLPFGAGPRACIGLVLAQMNLPLLALEFASAFDLTFQDKIPAPMPSASVTLIPPAVELRAALREIPVELPVAAE